MSKKKKPWIKFRHKVVRNLAYWVIKPYCVWKYGVTIEHFKEETQRQYLILMNHQTAFDQFFVGIAVDGPIYYLASEDLFSNGFVSSLIRYLVAPIPIKKQTTDIQAVRNCVRVAKEGGTIALAPEGNRTYSGKTEYMNPSIVSMIRVLKLPVLLFRIEGGYGVQPRWSDVLRKGKMKAYVSRVVEPEEYKDMSDEELFELIQSGLYVNEAVADHIFTHKKLAEYMERALYVCPYCGLSVLESHDDIVRCTTCNREIRYLPTKELEGVGFSFPFSFVNDWYEYQKDFVNQLDVIAHTETPFFEDTACLSEVIVYKNKKMLKKQAKICLYGDRIAIDELVFPFADTTAISVLGRNKLNIYYDKKVYQLKGDKRFNAIKYVNIFYRHKNVSKGDRDGKFLGL